MHKYEARFATKDELPNLAAWLHDNLAKNHYDPDIFTYPSTSVVAVDKDGNPMCYLPFQATIMTDALAPKPARTIPEIAAALKAAIHFVARLAKKAHIGEIYFLADPEDKGTIDYATKHGYESLNLTVMRLKLKNMVPPLPEDMKES